MQAREAGSAAAEVPLGPLRRYTEWTLAAIAVLPVLLPAVELAVRDLGVTAKLATGAVLVAVGIVQWRLVFAGMAGLDRRRPDVVRAVAAAVAGLVLWALFASWSAAPPVWALPFGMVASGVAIGVGERARRRLVGGACGLCAAVGVAAGYADEGARQAAGLAVVGAVMVAACAWIILASIWIWDVTLRLDQARSAAAELAVLRERLRFAGDLHDVQGHHLEAIAMKAELARRLVGVDDDAARGHAADAQQLARTALGETRAARSRWSATARRSSSAWSMTAGRGATPRLTETDRASPGCATASRRRAGAWRPRPGAGRASRCRRARPGDAASGRRGGHAPHPRPLTERELELLRLVREGLGAAAIADRVHLAPGTVRNYLSTAMARLGAASRADAARIAYDQGWI